MHKALLCFAAEFVGVERVCEIVVDVCRVQRCDQISKCMSIGGFVEGAKGRVSRDVELVCELRGRLFGQACNSCQQVLVPFLKRLLDALVELLVASGCFYSP